MTDHGSESSFLAGFMNDAEKNADELFGCLTRDESCLKDTEGDPNCLSGNVTRHEGCSNGLTEHNCFLQRDIAKHNEISRDVCTFATSQHHSKSRLLQNFNWNCALTINMCWWLVLLCSVTLTTASSFTNCRVTMKDPRGVITTPNFPGPYPVPINCQWVIEAPSDKVIAVYFTQFYMREGLKATEYAYYSPNVKMGKAEFGTISSEREPTYLVSNKPVLVLDFTVREVANIHMRVREYLLDVFGFNITYEFLSRNESVRKDACLYHHCSFTGNCYATPGYDKYYCSCFSKYFGEECQYDAECGPDAIRNMCQNGGICRVHCEEIH